MANLATLNVHNIPKIDDILTKLLDSVSNILERLPSISPLFGIPAIVTRVTGQTVCTSTTPTTNQHVLLLIELGIMVHVTKNVM